jgi:hypothetical protein
VAWRERCSSNKREQHPKEGTMDEKKKNETTQDELNSLDDLLEVLGEDELRHLAWGGRNGPRTVGPGHGTRT